MVYMVTIRNFAESISKISQSSIPKAEPDFKKHIAL